MKALEKFLSYLSGKFDNHEQLAQMPPEESAHFPSATHRNTCVNDCIKNLPSGFSGVFVLEESYYTLSQRTAAQPHLFLITEDAAGDVVLSSYTAIDVPKESLKYSGTFQLDYTRLSLSEKFCPLTYQYTDGVFTGANESMFTPVTKFVLDEKISENELVIQESMWVNGKRTFGFDKPIIYRRCQ